MGILPIALVLVVQNSVTNAAYDLQATSTAIQRQVPTSKLLQLLSDQLLHQQLLLISLAS